MVRTQPKTVAEWMKTFWIYDIGSGDNCTIGCESCKHTVKSRELLTFILTPPFSAFFSQLQKSAVIYTKP